MKTLYLLLILLLPVFGFTQLQVERAVISASGMSQSDELIIDGTLGETFIGFKSGNELSATIGFHQLTSMMTAVSFSDFKDLTVYPNPTFGKITLAGIPQSSIIEILDGRGVLIDRYQGMVEMRAIDLSDLNAGVYYLKIEDEKGSLIGSVAIMKLE